MKTYYSIIFVTIRPNILERIAVGLVLANPNKAEFYYSKNKLQNSKLFVSNESFLLLKDILKNIEIAVKKHNKIIEDKKETIFESQITKLKELSSDYLEYLSRYNSNLLTFSKPQFINVEVNKENFEKLFIKFIGGFGMQEEIKKNIHDIKFRVQNKLFPRIRSKVNINVKLTPDNFNHLIYPIKVDFTGKNDILIIGDTIDFKKQTYNLENDVAKLFVLNEAIKESKVESKSFVIGDEPPKSMIEEHSIWNNTRKAKFLEYVPIGEIEKISEYIQKHDVSPLFNVTDS